MHTWLIFILYSAPLSLRVALSYVTLSLIMRKLWQPQIILLLWAKFDEILLTRSEVTSRERTSDKWSCIIGYMNCRIISICAKEGPSSPRHFV